MKKLFIWILLCALLPAFSYAQAPDTLWTKTYGGPNSDSALSVEETLDGGYIIAGTTTDFGGGLRNIWLLKTDINGDTLWTNTFGGTGDHHGRCVRQTADSGYIITGSTADLGLIADMILVKTDASGNAIWTEVFGGADYDEGNCVCQTSDGGYVAAGMTESFGGSAQIYMIKTDANGDSLWAKVYGNSLWDEPYAIQETADSGFIVTGYTTVSSGPGGPDSDVLLLKTDANGDSLWARTYELNPAQEYRDYGYSVQQTTDGGYIIAGETWYPGTPAWEIDIYLVKTNPNGDTMWTRTYDRAATTDKGRAVQQVDDGGYIIAGHTQFIGIDYDFYLIRTDANGDTLWTQTFGDSQAPTPWEQALALDRTSDGGYIVAGFTFSYGAGSSDIWLVKTGPDIGIEEHKTQVPNLLWLRSMPNPFTRVTEIRYSILDSRFLIQNPTLEIYDITGCLVKSFNLGSSIQNQGSAVSWDGRDNQSRMLGSGVYFLRLGAGDYSTASAITILR